MKIGSVRYEAYIDDVTGKIDIDEIVLRSTSNRSKFGGIRYCNPVKIEFWVFKIPRITWVKRSTKHFDWGWASNIPEEYRRHRIAEGDRPGKATKISALKDLLSLYRRYPDDSDEDILSSSALIKKIETRINRESS